jgi:murein DD-endopeptidase MepM/ murein hydrolase activator NlpD
VSRTRRRAVPGIHALVFALLLPLFVVSGSAAQERPSDEVERELGDAEREAGELRSELDRVRNRLADAEVELAAIGARLQDARGRLTAAEGQVALGEEALDEAEREQVAAERAHRRALELLSAAEQELADEEQVLVDQLVHTFKYGTAGAQRGAMALEVLRRAEDPNAFAVGLKQLQTVVDVQESTVTGVFELREAREGLADDAARASGRAVQATADAAATLETLQELRAEAAQIADEVAAEEAAQQQLLTSLQLTEEQTADLVRSAAARQGQLETELRETRAAERRAAEAEARRAAEAEAARRRASSGGSGGTSSGTGRLGTPGAAGGSAVAGIVCPVQGAVAGRDFSNDWGYPRAGGRFHQGNDIFAARGVPVVAVQDATIVRWNPPSAPTGLGGITVTYRTADGSEWYNAHLDTVAAGIAPGVSVSRGQTIGTVGQTGNARTTPPHLHLGRRQGGAWVNPWPTVAPVC